ncbi:DDE-type integrase/transposase/recombinase [Spiroplasma endosymbiont of Atherix ibis]|uniref:DDE-type integrase/transposase/recombinase n=2 Tax=Spiroplasma endosymbiont of Atherix ibis TaxID=3066291 RepID=UPI0030D477AD
MSLQGRNQKEIIQELLINTKYNRTIICKILNINRTSTYKENKTLMNFLNDTRIMNLVISEIEKNNFLSAYSAKRWSLYFKLNYIDPFRINHKKLERIFKKFNHIAYYIKKQTKHEIKKYKETIRKNYLKEAKEMGFENIWTSDITQFSVKTKKGYICTVQDNLTGEIIGKSKRIDNQKTNFVLEAVKMAYKNKKYLGPILLHSDNGNQYTSENYINLCNDLQIIRSYSKPGTPHHNGKHESFHSRLKDETIRTCHIENIN